MIEIEIQGTRKALVKYLKVAAGVRYWEDATVNDIEDSSGTLIPCRAGNLWMPVIDIESGTIEGWPTGTTASVHYKVCDAGRYTLLNAERMEAASIDGYVPKIMSPGDNGYGDYIIMSIDGAGKINKWRVDLSEFEAA